MASNIMLIVEYWFVKVAQVVDRLHVQYLPLEVRQNVKINHYWEAIDEENEAIERPKKSEKVYCPQEFTNGDSKKQRLAKSRYLLYKSVNKWTDSQKERTQMLFQACPDIKTAYDLNQKTQKFSQYLT